MAVNMQCEGWRGMIEALLDDLWMHTLAKKQSRVAVTQIVKPDPGNTGPFHDAPEVAPHDVVGAKRSAVRLAEHEVAVVVLGAQPILALPLLFSEGPKSFHQSQGKRDCAPDLVRLWVFENLLTPKSVKCLSNTNLAKQKIQILPPYRTIRRRARNGKEGPLDREPFLPDTGRQDSRALVGVELSEADGPDLTKEVTR